jgi:hypothetical protein
MGLRLKERICELPEYNDGRVFDWRDFNHYLELGDYIVMHRFNDVWEIFYKFNTSECERLSSRGSKDFCMKCVEHQIRQDEMDKSE